MNGKPELGRDAREARTGEEPVRARPALLDDLVLQQPVHEDHVGTLGSVRSSDGEGSDEFAAAPDPELVEHDVEVLLECVRGDVQLAHD